MNKLYLTLIIAMCLASCSGRSAIPETEDIESDSIQSEQPSISKDVDIPRTHLGVTLGMSYDEAKSLLLGNVCKAIDENVDNEHKSILVEQRGDWLGDWGAKYSKFYIETFDGKVYSISLEPQNNPAEVLEALKQKYPFNVEESEELRYHRNGLVSKVVKKEYSCSNGKTEIYFDESSYMIRYRDVRLKEAKSKYWEEVETLSKRQLQEEVNQQLSDY